MSGVAARSSRRLAAVAVLSFLASQAAAALMGVRFDARPLSWFMQYLDPVLLSTRLLESVWYLHSQPPLANLLLGVVLELSPAGYPEVCHAAFLVMGGLLAAALVTLLLRLGVDRLIALALTVVFVASPPLVLYGNWLFYTLPDALLLVLSALALDSFLTSRRTGAALAFFTLLVILGLTRSLFHLGYIALLLAGLALVLKTHRRRLVLAALGPLSVLTALYAKNLVIFGRFAASTWLGMNFWGVVATDFPSEQRRAMVAAGQLSPVALIDRFSAVEDYPDTFDRPARLPGIPALHQAWKSTGYPNFNHIAYIGIADAYGRDGLAAVRQRPSVLLKGLAKSYFAYFKAASDYVLLEPNRTRIAAWTRVYDVLQGRLPVDLAHTHLLPVRSDRGQFVYLFLLLGLVASFGYGLVAAVRGLRSGSGRDRSRPLTVLYLCVTIAYVALVGNLMEAGENNRFRFETDPLSVALLGLLAQRLFTRARPKN